MKVYNINEQQFDAEINCDGIVVAKFFGSWCGPCKMVASIIDEMDDDRFKGLKMINLDVDKCEALTKRFSIVTVPTFIIFKDGAELEKISGFRNQKQLTEIFDKYLNSGK